jgi:hypothetical protein
MPPNCAEGTGGDDQPDCVPCPGFAACAVVPNAPGNDTSPSPPPPSPTPPKNDTAPTCPNMVSGRVDTDKGTYKPGDVVGIIGEYTSNHLQYDEDGLISFRMYDSNGIPFGVENLISPKASEDKGPCWLEVEWYASNWVLSMPGKLGNGTVIYGPGMWKGVAEFGGSESSFLFRVLPMEEPQPDPFPFPPALIPFRMMWDRADDCSDEVSYALGLLLDKAPTWYDFVRDHTASVGCPSNFGPPAAGQTIILRLMINWFFGWPVSADYDISTWLYDDDVGNTKERKILQIVALADTLVHEACHVKQWQDGRWIVGYYNKNRLEVECYKAAMDAFTDIGDPSYQWVIDWNQRMIDYLSGRLSAAKTTDIMVDPLPPEPPEGELGVVPSAPAEEEQNVTAVGNATIPEGPGEFGPVVPPPPFAPDDNQTQPGEEGSSRAEEE